MLDECVCQIFYSISKNNFLCQFHQISLKVSYRHFYWRTCVIKRFFQISTVILTALLSTLGSQANRLGEISPDTQILIFTTQQYPVDTHQYPQATVYHIDAVNQLENMSSFTFKGTPQQAEQQARAFIQSPEFKTYETQLKRGYERLVRAFYLGVKKVPAIVFYSPRTALYQAVYGTTNLTQATSIFLQYQQQAQQ